MRYSLEIQLALKFIMTSFWKRQVYPLNYVKIIALPNTIYEYDTYLISYLHAHIY